MRGALLIVALTGLALPGACDLDSWVQNTDTGHWYARWDATGTWAAANQAIADYNDERGENAHLVTFSDAAEENWVQSEFGTDTRFWIGFTDSPDYGATPDEWIWITGETVAYTNWHTGEPNNQGGDEQFALMNWYGGWNDADANATADAIFERSPDDSPEPGVWILLACSAGLGGLARRGRTR